jgi:hypothetical protein
VSRNAAARDATAGGTAEDRLDAATRVAA